MSFLEIFERPRFVSEPALDSAQASESFGRIRIVAHDSFQLGASFLQFPHSKLYVGEGQPVTIAVGMFRKFLLQDLHGRGGLACSYLAIGHSGNTASVAGLRERTEASFGLAIALLSEIE